MKVFLSCAVNDRELVDKLVDLLQLGVGLSRDDVLYMDTPNGEYFVQNTLRHLYAADIVIAVLSPAYLKSQFCLAEVGGEQLRKQVQCNALFYSVLIPPATYDAHLRGVLFGVQSGFINDTASL